MVASPSVFLAATVHSAPNRAAGTADSITPHIWSGASARVESLNLFNAWLRAAVDGIADGVRYRDVPVSTC